MRPSLRNLLLWGAAATLTTSSLWGQTPTPRQKVDLAVTYLAQRSNLTPGHSEDSLAKALWFFKHCAKPSEGFAEHCGDWVALSAANES